MTEHHEDCIHCAWQRVKAALPEGFQMTLRVEGHDWGGSVALHTMDQAAEALSRLADALEGMPR